MTLVSQAAPGSVEEVVGTSARRARPRELVNEKNHKKKGWKRKLVGGLEHDFYFPIYVLE